MTNTVLASYHSEGYATETAIITAGPVVLHSDEGSFQSDAASHHAAGAQAVLNLNCQRDPVTQAWEMATETHDAGFTMTAGSPIASAAPDVAVVDGNGSIRQHLRFDRSDGESGSISDGTYHMSGETLRALLLQVSTTPFLPLAGVHFCRH